MPHVAMLVHKEHSKQSEIWVLAEAAGCDTYQHSTHTLSANILSQIFNKHFALGNHQYSAVRPVHCSISNHVHYHCLLFSYINITVTLWENK